MGIDYATAGSKGTRLRSVSVHGLQSPRWIWNPWLIDWFQVDQIHYLVDKILCNIIPNKRIQGYYVTYLLTIPADPDKKKKKKNMRSEETYDQDYFGFNAYEISLTFCL